MPLRATDASGKNWYSFLDDHTQEILRMSAGSLICPHCHAKMAFRPSYVRRGFKVSAHFAHVVRMCTDDYEQQPESQEHHTAKELVVRQLQQKYKEYREAIWETESRLDEIRRIADVLFTFPDGRRVAHEIQLSPQGVAEFIRRTDDYKRLAIDVVWWLGPKVKQHAQWCMENIGVCGYVEVTDGQDITPLGSNQDRAA